MTLYAIFNRVNVRNNIDTSLFKMEVTSGESENGYAPVILSPQDDATLIGKITIPIYFNHHPVVGLRGFNATRHQITHIFFENAAYSKVKTIYLNCFSDMSTLIYFEWPEHLEKIENKAFYNTHL